MTAKLEQLAGLLESHNLTRLEYEQGDLRVVMERQPAPSLAPAPSASPLSPPLPAVSAPPAPAPGVPAPGVPATTSPSLALTSDVVASDAATVTVAAPLVGVVYRSREPSAAPFVACGQQVAEGEVLCLIEAMKLFNEVLAPCAGTIGAILFEDGMLAEYGAPLFSILPAPPASPNPPNLPAPPAPPAPPASPNPPAPPTSDSAPPTPPPAPPASGSASAAPSPVG